MSRHEAPEPLETGYYQHYKGGIYNVLMTATDEGDGLPVIVYESAGGRVWTRPIADFIGWVQVDGKDVERFRKLRINEELLPSLTDDAKRDLIKMMQRYVGIEPLKTPAVEEKEDAVTLATESLGDAVTCIVPWESLSVEEKEGAVDA